MKALRQLFYVSRASEGVGTDDIGRILQASRVNNDRRDITGCLLYSGRHFAQTLEGSAEALDAVVPKILADPRHAEAVMLVDRETSLRKYPSWSMGYLYSLDLQDRPEALLQSQAVAGADALQLMAEVKPDSVMGGL